MPGVMRMARAVGDGAADWEQTSLFIGEGWLLTFQEQWGHCLDPVRARLREGLQTIRKAGADYLASMVIDAVVDGYFPLLELFGETLEDLEDRIVEDPRLAALADVYRMKRELMIFRRAAWPLRDTLSQLLRDGHRLFAAETLPYLSDAEDHVIQLVDVIETYRELAGSFIDVYLSSVGNRTNSVMRVLTVISTIFIPLTFLAGVYGMNFDRSAPLNMPELGWRYGYVPLLVRRGALERRAAAALRPSGMARIERTEVGLTLLAGSKISPP